MLTSASAASMDVLPSSLDTLIQLVAFAPANLIQIFIQASSDLIQGGFAMGITGLIDNFINTLS